VDIILETFSLIFANFKNTTKQVFYVHNLNFDGLLLIESLSKSKLYTFNAFIKDMSIYNISVFFNGRVIEFKCSYKILPISLATIAQVFNLAKKLPFPYKFSTFENLNYIGSVPDKTFFESAADYKKFKNVNIFNFKQYSIEYCLNDVRITSAFMTLFKNIIAEFKINIADVLSAPSLSLKIFTKEFNKNKLQLNQNQLTERLLRPSYFGGRCEVYGNPKKGDYVFHYDFEGMYAQCMKERFCFGAYKIVEKDFNLKTPGFY
jgi:hypothetical protein